MADYNINYDDEKFKQVENAKNEALTEIEQTYGGMVNESDKYYQAQIDASKEWADKQAQIQQDNTDFALEQIKQQKEQANKDYLKEQSGAYADWQKQSNQYGADAEQMAANGLSNTGYSESSKVGMYNAYQNRVALARDSYNRAVLNYDNAMKDAVLQNNATLAQIAYEALQQQLELSLQGFQYKNQLLLEQQNMKQQAEDRYYSRYQDVLAQMNQENALAEQIRQYEQDHALQVKNYEESIRQFDLEMERLKKKDAEEYEMEIKQLELQKAQLEEQKRQANMDYDIRMKQLAEQKRQADLDYEISSKKLESEQQYPYITKDPSDPEGGNGGNLRSGVISALTPKISSGTNIKTNYYSGEIAENVGGFGYMGKDLNGVAYQPKGVEIYGNAYKLSKYGKTAGEVFGSGVKNSSGVNISSQNIWQAKDNNGKTYYFIWNGTKNEYERIEL